MKTFLCFWVSCSLVGNLLAERSQLLRSPTFRSTNFDNILTWETTEDVPPGTVYDVEYKKYGNGELWHKKSECQNISWRFCNLTRETENFNEWYFGRVRINGPNCCISEWIRSNPRFRPRDETNIGEPEVKYTPTNHSIKFFVQPPYTPLRDEDNQPLTVEDIFSSIENVDIIYQITIFCDKTQQTWVKQENNKTFEISDLEPGTKYNGTIRMVFSGATEKKSKPHVFVVRTLPDNTWLPYLFGIAVFMTISIFATICYFIYKYIKLHAVRQPMSLDFKDISHFQTLKLSTEHVLTLHDPSKPPQISPGMQPAQINHHLQGVLEHPTFSTLPETSYQQRAKVTPFQRLAHPKDQADGLPMGYAPQVVKNNPSCRLDHNPSTSTYGICVEGMDKTHFPPNQGARLQSLVEVPISDGQYRVQKPKQIERGLCPKVIEGAPASVRGDAEETQQLLFEEIPPQMPGQFPYLVQKRAPAVLDEGPGSYRKQTVELSPSAFEPAQSAISEDRQLLPQSILEHCACDNPSQNHSTGQHHVAWNPFAWTDSQCWPPSGCQRTDPVAQKSKVVTGEPEPHNAETLDFAPVNGLFTGLFRDLELKLQWDHEPD